MNVVVFLEGMRGTPQAHKYETKQSQNHFIFEEGGDDDVLCTLLLGQAGDLMAGRAMSLLPTRNQSKSMMENNTLDKGRQSLAAGSKKCKRHERE